MTMRRSTFSAAICTLVLATAGCGTLVAGPGQTDVSAWMFNAQPRAWARPAHMAGFPSDQAVASGTEPVWGAEAPFVAPLAFVPMQNRARGAVLDVWLNNREGDLRTLTSERSLGTAVVQGDYFRYNKVNSIADLRAFWGKPMVLKWTALYQVMERGPHVFLFELSKERAGRAISAQTMVVLNEEIVFQKQARTYGSGSISEVDSHVVTLAPGFYRLEVWLAATHQPNRNPPVDTQLGTYIKVRVPSDQTPQPLPSARIWHRTR